MSVQLIAPNGKAIHAVMQEADVWSMIDGFEEHLDGSLEPNWDGDTEFDLKGDLKIEGQRLLVDVDGTLWLERECRREYEAEPEVRVELPPEVAEALDDADDEKSDDGVYLIPPVWVEVLDVLDRAGRTAIAGAIRLQLGCADDA